jgi:anion-transporting  ArsA/GET3 family ATPase
MNFKDFEQMSLHSLAEIMERFHEKNIEYASAEDVFSNFKRAAGGLSYHCKAEQVAWEYAVKHLQSVKDMIASETSTAEAIDEKIGDVIAYMLIIKGMLYKRIEYSPDYPNYEDISNSNYSFDTDIHDKLIYTFKSE